MRGNKIMSKVDSLRKVLAEQPVRSVPLQKLSENSWTGVDAYVIGTEDAHQSEYVSAFDKRREWISEFTGSAGTALVTKDKALLWTDGRYFLQAESQLSDQWTLMKSGEPQVPSLEKWVEDNISKGERVGIDPFLTSVSLARKLAEALTKKEAHLVQHSQQQNPIDTLWIDQPSVSKGSVVCLDEKYTGQSLQDKLKTLRSELKAKKATATVLTALDDIAWVFNIRGSDIEFNPVCVAYAFITLDSAILFIDSDKVNDTVRSHFGNHVNLLPYSDIVSEIENYVKTSPSGRILIDVDQCNVAVHSAVPDTMRKEHRSLVLSAKTKKNHVELEGLRQAHIRDGAALVKFFSWLEIQMNNDDQSKLTEVSVADMEQKFREDVEDFVSLSFDTISSTGANGAIIHYKPEPETCATLSKNELYLNDSGGQYLDGTTDVTRTLHFGTPTEYERECFTRVLKGHIALATVVFPDGIEGVKLDTVARLSLWRAGLDYGHGTGHGVGAYLNVHEKGVLLSSRANVKGLGIGTGMVISNEPGYYEDGKFGIRIESVMIVNQVGSESLASGNSRKFCSCETITMAPIQRSLIKKELLTEDEITWVNEYHATVREKLSELVQNDPNAYNYLQRETQPL